MADSGFGPQRTRSSDTEFTEHGFDSKPPGSRPFLVTEVTKDQCAEGAPVGGHRENLTPPSAELCVLWDGALCPPWRKVRKAKRTDRARGQGGG